jgi:hypothetical protein
MDQLTVGYLGFLVFVILIFLRVPIAYGIFNSDIRSGHMGGVGLEGVAVVYG